MIWLKWTIINKNAHPQTTQPLTPLRHILKIKVSPENSRLFSSAQQVETRHCNPGQSAWLMREIYEGIIQMYAA